MSIQKLTVKEIEANLDSLDLESKKKYLTSLAQDERKSVIKLVAKYNKKIEKHILEKERLMDMWKIEKSIYSDNVTEIVGIDEAGRGPLAGPVVAAAVILPPFFLLEGLNDSKKISEKKRVILAEKIKKSAISWSVGIIDAKIIDEINILEATRHAMNDALNSLAVKGQFVFVDGIFNPVIKMKQKAIIKGDSYSASIAAASIIAKTYRDNLMYEYDKIYPEYGFKIHKGYGTKLHLDALKKYGPSPIHRRSFSPVSDVLRGK